MADTLEAELQAGLEEHRRWQGNDFVTAQVMLWIAIAASVVGSITAAGVLPLPKLLAAVIAALPGTVILVDRTFKFGTRSAWHAIYSARLRALKRQLQYDKEPESVVGKKLTELEIEMEKLFPVLDPGLLRDKTAPANSG